MTPATIQAAYLVPVGAQAFSGFLAIAFVSREFGYSGLAAFGLVQVGYQVFSIILPLGLAPIIAVQFVSLSSSPSPSSMAPIRDRYAQAVAATLVTGSVATLGCALLASSLFPPFAVACGAVTGLVRLRSSRLRGLELHKQNIILLSVVALSQPAMGIATASLYNEVDAYWTGALGGLLMSWAVSSKPSLLRPLTLEPAFVLSGLRGLPHQLAIGLQVSVLRFAGAIGGGTQAASDMVIATQFNQVTSMLQGAYWSERTPHAVRMTHGTVSDQRNLTRAASKFSVAVAVIGAIAAYPALYILIGSEPSTLALVSAIVLCCLPLCSVSYDAYAVVLWREMRTGWLSTTSLVGLGVTAGLAFAASSVYLYLIPVAALAGRLTQGFLVRHVAQSILRKTS